MMVAVMNLESWQRFSTLTTWLSAASAHVDGVPGCWASPMLAQRCLTRKERATLWKWDDVQRGWVRARRFHSTCTMHEARRDGIEADGQSGIHRDFPAAPIDAEGTGKHRRRLLHPDLLLAWASIGIIIGDIGTSPLYVFSSISNSLNPTKEDVVMFFSLVFWTLTLVAALKYTCIITPYFNDRGEGGSFALYSRICRTIGILPTGSMSTQLHEQLLSLATRPMIRRGNSLSTRSVDHSDSLHHVTSLPRGDSLARGAAQPKAWWNYGALPGQAICKWFREHRNSRSVLLAIVVIESSMVIGDGVLTPTISVVSAVSGLQLISDKVTAGVVMGVSCAILVLLFAFQSKGTARVGLVFSPVVAIWLAANAAIGIYNLASNPGGHGVFKGFSPHYIVLYFAKHGEAGWRALGAVMLCVTGAEAMFADIGHFNARSIQMAFIGYAYPCLILTYLGQAAYLSEHTEEAATIYWSSVPEPVFWPMLILATLATVVAAQALISACFSICRSAMALGVFPKWQIIHTGKQVEGQVYLPSVNYSLLVATVACVVGFKGDTIKLSQAYGLTISAVFLISTCLVTLLMIISWELSVLIVVPFFLIFGLVDGAFLSANLEKVPHGAWVALLISALVALVQLTWWTGQGRKQDALNRYFRLMPQDMFTVVQSTASLPQLKAPNPEHPAPLHNAISAPAHMESVPPNAAVSGGGGECEARTGEAWDLALLKGEVSLALTIAPEQPLVTLPGVGIYYNQDTKSVPAVLLHFMRNVRAIHEVNVFLTVRYLPIPVIPPEERLVVAPVPGLPAFYRVRARYGYLDVVDHGPVFMNDLIATLVKDIDKERAEPRHAEVAQEPAPPPASALSMASVFARPGAVTLGLDAAPPTTVQHAHSRHGAHTFSRFGGPKLPAARTLPATLELVVKDARNSVERRPEDRSLARSVSLQVPFQPPRASLDLAGLNRTLATTSMGHLLTGTATEGPSHGGVQPLPIGSASRKRITTLANDLVNAAHAQPDAGLEVAALRAALLVDAAKGGVVFYSGRTTLRMEPNSSILHDFVFESLYKPMLLLSYSKDEAWRVPVNNLVELGMVVFI